MSRSDRNLWRLTNNTDLLFDCPETLAAL